MRLRRLAGIIVCCAAAGTAWPNSAHGDDVLPGHDLFTTLGSDSGHDFAETPIPADFFGPGSDPFVGAGRVAMTGSPLGSYNGYAVGAADTIVRRVDTAVEAGGSINIELVALSLKSVNPITVTYDGGQNSEQWDVELRVSPTTASVGTMTIFHTASGGGTYDADLNVVPLFIFTSVVGRRTVELDGTDIEYLASMSTTNSPTWGHEPKPGQLVVPGLTGDETNLAGDPWENDFYIDPYTPTRHTGPHPTVVATKEAQIPTLPEWGLAALTLLVLTAATVVFGRRRRAAA